MAIVVWLPGTRLQAKERQKVEQRQCTMCQGFLHRIAERGHLHPYRWIVVGYRCMECRTVYMDSDVEF